MDKIRIVIADDHSMIRHGIKQILELEDDITVIAQASDGEEAIKLVKEKKPDIVLMDINMPGINGIQAIKVIKQEPHPSKVIVLTIHDDREYLFKTIQLGAEGYVLKDAEPSVLIDAIRNINIGNSYIEPNMTKVLVKEFNRVTLNGNENVNESEKYYETKLTVREIEVLQLIAEGLLNKEIASHLYISEKTVKNHVSSIFKKLNVTDRTQAAIYALKNHIKS